ncbi:BRO family protein, partial [Pseudomonas sp. NY11226]|uniref:BRO family protein n=1 Tax=Pseudomonas sp. NY11226 TaxID=3400362 RepID=UPI003A83E041
MVGADKKSFLNIPQRADTRNWSALWLMPESSLYTMLLRGHAPLSEPFRRWVTEEVLPTIRKTGRYDASESSVYEMLTRV